MGSTSEQVFRERVLRRGSVVAPNGFEIEYFAERQILVSTLRGFWTEETAQKYQQALDQEMVRIRRTCPRFACLSDARGFPVQTERVMKILTKQSTASEGVRKLAIVVSTALNTMQAQRFFQSDRIRVFKDVGEASVWLESTAKLKIKAS